MRGEAECSDLAERVHRLTGAGLLSLEYTLYFVDEAWVESDHRIGIDSTRGGWAFQRRKRRGDGWTQARQGYRTAADAQGAIDRDAQRETERSGKQGSIVLLRMTQENKDMSDKEVS